MPYQRVYPSSIAPYGRYYEDERHLTAKRKKICNNGLIVLDNMCPVQAMNNLIAYRKKTRMCRIQVGTLLVKEKNKKYFTRAFGEASGNELNDYALQMGGFHVWLVDIETEKIHDMAVSDLVANVETKYKWGDVIHGTQEEIQKNGICYIPLDKERNEHALEVIYGGRNKEEREVLYQQIFERYDRRRQLAKK